MKVSNKGETVDGGWGLEDKDDEAQVQILIEQTS